MTLRPRMRPEFTLDDPEAAATLLCDLRAMMADGAGPYVGQVLNRHAYLQLPRTERSLLSPYLNLQIVEDEGRTVVKGRFTPHPAVWTGFMAVYGSLGMVGLCGLVYGLAQLTVQQAPWALLAAPTCAALAAFVYGAALIGQGLTMDQMYEMRVFIEQLARDRARSDSPARPCPDLV